MVRTPSGLALVPTVAAAAASDEEGACETVSLDFSAVDAASAVLKPDAAASASEGVLGVATVVREAAGNAAAAVLS